ncbi:DUF4153 domain-containing protein [Pedobacter hartonius]|nr:DUF4153 domain-containing protein [Pedobacter hartonius]
MEILFACIGTTAAIIGIKTDFLNDKVSNWSWRVIMTANIGLLVSLSVSLYTESKMIKGKQMYLFKIPAALLAGSLVFFLNPMVQRADITRFCLISLSGHLLVSFSAYIQSASIQGFWQFNKTLFIRFLTSVLYSAVLYIGLAAAMSATKFLFNFDIGSHAYAILWVCITGLFNTIFFLSGVPEDLPALNEDFSYPKGLKVFTQYVLIPLATVYVMILLAYEAKILVEWNLPKGLVSNIILGYAVFGILSLLLVFPIREQAENGWIKTYARSFYFLMLPLIALLFLAAGTRVFRYGITELRYFLILLAFWLLLITIYSLVSHRQNIKLIPVSLCVFALLAVYGPQSAFSVSVLSQTRILTGIFQKNNAFEHGKMVRLKKINKKDGIRAAQTLRYIVEHYDYQILQHYLSQDLNLIADSLANTREMAKVDRFSSQYDLRIKKTEWLQNHLGLGEFSTYADVDDSDQQPANETYLIKDSQTGLLHVTGYDFILEESTTDERGKTNMAGPINFEKSYKGNGLLFIRLNNDSAVFNIKGLVSNLLKDPVELNSHKETNAHSRSTYQYNLPSVLLSISQDTKNFRIIYKINSIRFNGDQNKRVKDITYTNGVFLIKAR